MNVCIFCGSASGTRKDYADAAIEMGGLICKSRSSLIYGGGNVGLMGIVADEVMRLGGQVIGVIPDFLLQREVAHKGITQLEVVNSMHERKRRMADLADAFVAMPGGWGTLDELAEILTWKQLGLIHASVGLLNTQGYFNPLIQQMQVMVKEEFLQAKNFNELKISESPHQLLKQLGVITG
jgi:uncharacterized protein (TIGR00730 family)